jgi:hypothetical protein
LALYLQKSAYEKEVNDKMRTSSSSHEFVPEQSHTGIGTDANHQSSGLPKGHGYKIYYKQLIDPGSYTTSEGNDH